MSVQRDVWSASISGPKDAAYIVPADRSCSQRLVLARMGRVGLAAIVALVSLVGLMSGLQAAKAAVVDVCSEPVTLAQADDEPDVTVTKTVEPPDPDTGDVVTITFVITGVGPRSLDVALVQDVSGSMDDPITGSNPPNRLPVSKEAAWTFVGELQPNDEVAVVAYNNAAWLEQPLTANTGTISVAINSLQAGGQTDISAGLGVAQSALLTTSARPSNTVEKVIVLLSDGMANLPGSEIMASHAATTEAHIAASKGISIFSIGLGQETSGMSLLQEIAEIGGGEYYFAPTSATLHTVYMSIALRLRNLTVVDVLTPSIYIDCPPTATCAGTDSTTITWPISDEDLLGGSPVTVAFTVTVNSDPPYVGLINGADSHVEYDVPGAGLTDTTFTNPTVTVGGRKIAGIVFDDLDGDGGFDEGEESLIPGVKVTTSNRLMCETDVSGTYTFRTSTAPTLAVAISIPTGYVTTTREVTYVQPLSDTYRRDFGLYDLTTLPYPSLELIANDRVVRPGAEVVYTYIVDNAHPAAAFVDCVVTDSLEGVVSPFSFAVEPGQSKYLSFTATLVKNTTATGTVACGVRGRKGVVDGGPAVTTVHVIEGISLDCRDPDPFPEHHGDTAGLEYTVVNVDEDDGVKDVSILITDTSGRTLDEVDYPELASRAVITPSLCCFTVPQDIEVALNTTAVDNVDGTLLISDRVTFTLCPEDIYENDDHKDYARLVSLDSPEVHDFSGDDDWAFVRLNSGEAFLYDFTAAPLSPNMVPISLTLYRGGTILAHSSNVSSPHSMVWIRRRLSCFGQGDVCDYDLRVQSPVSGCWTDYELLVRTVIPQIYLPIVLKQ